jgi:hypothetical protein
MRLLTLLLLIAFTGLPADAAPKKRDRPANLNAYSLKYWGRNSLKFGQVVTAATPYGTLTCWSTGAERARRCTLK